MSRKKITRSTKGKKTQAKTKIKSRVLSPVEKMEKDFRDAPAKLIAQYRAEISVLKQQEVKLKTEIKKATMLQKALKSKQAALSSKKLTAAAKKRLTSGKKVHDQLVKATKDFTAKLEQIKKQIKLHAEKQAKFSAINKLLSALEKQLKAESAKKTVKAKPSVKKKKASAKKAKTMQTSQQEATQTQDSAESATEAAEFNS